MCMEICEEDKRQRTLWRSYQYEAWQANRRKNVIDTLREVVERVKETSFEQPNQWVEKSIKLKEKSRLLDQENEKLRKEASQSMDHATFLQKELEKTKSFLRNQDKLLCCYESAFCCSIFCSRYITIGSLD